MFGFLGARRLAVAGVVVAGSMAVAVVQASAGSASPPKLPSKPASLKDAAAALAAQVKAHAGPTASATVNAAATNVHCGEVLTATTTLNGDLSCAGNGLTLGKNSITLNLGGHEILGSVGAADGTTGVRVNNSSDTVENGVIFGFYDGAVGLGTSDTLTTLQVIYTDQAGFYLVGTGDKATSDTAAENLGDGVIAVGASETVQSDHLLNDSYGLFAQPPFEAGTAMTILGNVADGNTNDGILVVGRLPRETLTGNAANFNGGLGINANSPVADGGTNTAKANTNSQQCRGVVCS
jgi:hypothetical protein